MVVVTYRPDAVAGIDALLRLLGDVASDSGTRRIDLAPLSVAAVRRLAEEHASADPGSEQPDAALLHRITGGNPFFVTEVLATPSSEVPVTVTDAVAARAARLSDEARRALDVLSVCGQRTELDLVEILLAEPGIQVLDEPIEHGVLILDGAEVRFRQRAGSRATRSTRAPGAEAEVAAAEDGAGLTLVERTARSTDPSSIVLPTTERTS